MWHYSNIYIVTTPHITAQHTKHTYFYARVELECKKTVYSLKCFIKNRIDIELEPHNKPKKNNTTKKAKTKNNEIKSTCALLNQFEKYRKES